MKTKLHCPAVCVLAVGILLLAAFPSLGAPSDEAKRKAELMPVMTESAKSINAHDAQRFGADLADDFISDNLNAPSHRGTS